MGTGRPLHKAGPDIEMSLDTVMFLYGEQEIYLNLWSVDILNISTGRVGQPDLQISCLLWLGKLLCIFSNDCKTWQEANVIVLEY